MTSGREHVPDRKTRAYVVRRKVGGATHQQIADRLDISTETLVKHYDIELQAEEEAIDKVAGVMYKRAFEGDVTAGKFILERKGKWILEKDSANDKDAAFNDAIRVGVMAALAAKEASDNDEAEKTDE